MVAWTTQDMLEALDCVVLSPAASVSQALGIIAAQVVDAAVLDVNLGDELSYPVADALTAQSVPYLFLTGYGIAGIQEAYRTAPVLQKPLRRSELVVTLGMMLEPSRRAAN